MTPLFDRSILALLDFVSSTWRIVALYVGNFLFGLFVYMIAVLVTFLEAMWWCS